MRRCRWSARSTPSLPAWRSASVTGPFTCPAAASPPARPRTKPNPGAENERITGTGPLAFAGVLTLASTRLRAGDTNDDDVINIGDATLVAANFRLSVPPADPRADINGDGVVNIKDLALLGFNYGRSGCQAW